VELRTHLKKTGRNPKSLKSRKNIKRKEKKKNIKILASSPFLRWIFDFLGFDFGIKEDFETEENPFNLDVNGDGVTDAIGTDLDGDGVVDHLSIDTDGIMN
jgi:hypothetical protein